MHAQLHYCTKKILHTFLYSFFCLFILLFLYSFLYACTKKSGKAPTSRLRLTALPLAFFGWKQTDRLLQISGVTLHRICSHRSRIRIFGWSAPAFSTARNSFSIRFIRQGVLLSDNLPFCRQKFLAPVRGCELTPKS